MTLGLKPGVNYRSFGFMAQLKLCPFIYVFNRNQATI